MVEGEPWCGFLDDLRGMQQPAKRPSWFGGLFGQQASPPKESKFTLANIRCALCSMRAFLLDDVIFN